MKFSVIIPMYNDWFRLMKCLDALEKQTIDRALYEIIVVNNGEDRTVPENVNWPQNICLVHEPKPGSYAARNKGVATSTGEILAFTDSDCIPDSEWLMQAEQYFKEQDCDLLGGKIEIFQNGSGSDYGYLYDRYTAFQQHKHIPEGKGATANLFVKRTVFDKMGGFDSNIKSGGDWDFTLRSVRQGYKIIYGDEVKVQHPARSLSNIFKKQYRLTCWGAVNVQNKYGHSQVRILGSHLVHGIRFKRDDLPAELPINDRMVIFTIDILRYVYRLCIHWGLLLRLIKPRKVRE